MQKLMRSALVVLIGCGLLAACKPAPDQHKNPPKTKYSRVYGDSEAHLYVRTWDDNNFTYWMYVLDNNSSPSFSSPPLSGGSWQRMSTPPTQNLSPTTKVVQDKENGEPTEEAKEATEVDKTDVVDENTTTEAAEVMEAEPAEPGTAASPEGNNAQPEADAPQPAEPDSSAPAEAPADTGSSGGDSPE